MTPQSGPPRGRRVVENEHANWHGSMEGRRICNVDGVLVLNTPHAWTATSAATAATLSAGATSSSPFSQATSLASAAEVTRPSIRACQILLAKSQDAITLIKPRDQHAFDNVVGPGQHVPGPAVVEGELVRVGGVGGVREGEGRSDAGHHQLHVVAPVVIAVDQGRSTPPLFGFT